MGANDPMLRPCGHAGYSTMGDCPTCSRLNAAAARDERLRGKNPIETLHAIGEDLPDPPPLQMNETLRVELLKLYISDMHALVFRLALRVLHLQGGPYPDDELESERSANLGHGHDGAHKG